MDQMLSTVIVEHGHLVDHLLSMRRAGTRQQFRDVHADFVRRLDQMTLIDRTFPPYCDYRAIVQRAHVELMCALVKSTGGVECDASGAIDARDARIRAIDAYVAALQEARANLIL